VIPHHVTKAVFKNGFGIGDVGDMEQSHGRILHI
jgi:hypothetical protein